MLLKTIRTYASLVKFSHTVFAMPFAVIGYLLGIRQQGGEPDWLLLLLVVLCMVFARSAAMAFNRWADRRYDGRNPRTQSREIPAGKLKARSALIFTILMSLLFIACTWFINSLCFMLSPLALLIVLGYSYTKRFTVWAHYVLGLGLALAPVGAFLAVTGRFEVLPLLYAGLVFFWVAGFDILYALQDLSVDKNEGLYSVPSRFGIRGALWLSALSHLMSTGFLLVAGFLGQGGLFFWLGAGLFITMLVMQHLKIRGRKFEKINQVFALTNGLAGLSLGLFYIVDFAAYIKIL